MFGGGFFGRQIPMKGAAPASGPLPVSQGPAAGRPAPVIGQVSTGPAPATPPGQFQQAPLIPPTRVPMGAKKDCPVCRG